MGLHVPFSIITQQKINALIYAIDVPTIITLIELIFQMSIQLKFHELQKRTTTTWNDKNANQNKK